MRFVFKSFFLSIFLTIFENFNACNILPFIIFNIIPFILSNTTLLIISRQLSSFGVSKFRNAQTFMRFLDAYVITCVNGGKARGGTQRMVGRWWGVKGCSDIHGIQDAHNSRQFRRTRQHGGTDAMHWRHYSCLV